MNVAQWEMETRNQSWRLCWIGRVGVVSAWLAWLVRTHFESGTWLEKKYSLAQRNSYSPSSSTKLAPSCDLSVGNFMSIHMQENKYHPEEREISFPGEAGRMLSWVNIGPLFLIIIWGDVTEALQPLWIVSCFYSAVLYFMSFIFIILSSFCTLEIGL